MGPVYTERSRDLSGGTTFHRLCHPWFADFLIENDALQRARNRMLRVSDVKMVTVILWMKIWLFQWAQLLVDSVWLNLDWWCLKIIVVPYNNFWTWLKKCVLKFVSSVKYVSSVFFFFFLLYYVRIIKLLNTIYEMKRLNEMKRHISMWHFLTIKFPIARRTSFSRIR